MKLLLLMGLIGHILCGVSDCLLTYAPNGKVNLTDFKDYEKSSVSFQGMPLKNLSLAMVLGVIAMTMELFGYTQLCDYVQRLFLCLLPGSCMHPRWLCLFPCRYTTLSAVCVSGFSSGSD